VHVRDWYAGDASHHKPVPHAAQFLYWLLFVLPVLGPVAWLSEIRRVVPRHFVAIAVASVALVVVLPSITFDHPYLLADNRHYAFYLWKRVFSQAWHRYALAPVYVVTGIVVWRRLSKGLLRFEVSYEKSSPRMLDVLLSGASTDSVMLPVAFLFCAFLTLAPSPLFECVADIVFMHPCCALIAARLCVSI
jgi:hypothetical protein